MDNKELTLIIDNALANEPYNGRYRVDGYEAMQIVNHYRGQMKLLKTLLS